MPPGVKARKKKRDKCDSGRSRNRSKPSNQRSTYRPPTASTLWKKEGKEGKAEGATKKGAGVRGSLFMCRKIMGGKEGEPFDVRFSATQKEKVRRRGVRTLKHTVRKEARKDTGKRRGNSSKSRGDWEKSSSGNTTQGRKKKTCSSAFCTSESTSPATGAK